jgi:hypothetical protein
MDQSPGRSSQSRDPDRASGGGSALLMQAALEYGPFLIAAILLTLSSLADEIPQLQNILPTSRVGLYVCVAFLALLAFVLRLTDRVADLSRLVRSNSEMQANFISAATETTTRVFLDQAFRLAEDVVSHCDRIRVYAITSKFVSQLMQMRFSAVEINLLVAAAGDNVDPLLDSEVHLSVLYTWVGRVRASAVGRLIVRQYDFYPTEWYVIFDERLMVTSSYVFDQHEIGNARTTDMAYIVRADDEGKQLIESKIESFDALFHAAETHFGEGKHEGTYQLIDGIVKKRLNNSEEWLELGPLNQAAWPSSRPLGNSANRARTDTAGPVQAALDDRV